MTFGYTQGIPFRTDNPSDDQPDMKINNDSNYGIWQVDHHGFAPDPTGGQHIQQTYPGFAAPSTPSASTAASVAYPAAGVDQNTTAQYYFQNVNATFPLSAIKAFGVFNGLAADGDVTIINSWNVNGNIVQTHTGTAPNFRPTWTINLNAGSTTNDHAAIFVLSSIALSNTATAIPFNWTLSSNILTIKFASSTPVIGYTGTINFLVMEI
jgi:hypothetical protein